MRGGRERPTCPACGWVWFNNAPVGVAAVILDEHGRILLARRRTAFRDGAWCIPCGYLEADEEVRAGLHREVKEETGLDVTIGELIAVHSNLDRAPPYPVGLWFATTINGGTLHAGSDVADLAFFDLADLPEPMAFETDLRVIQQLRDQRSNPDATVRELTAQMHGFVRAKGWYEPTSKRPQTPRNLAISLALEATEVLEHVQWRDDVQDQAKFAGELADVMLYLLQLADISGINLVEAVQTTLRRNAKRTWDQPETP